MTMESRAEPICVSCVALWFQFTLKQDRLHARDQHADGTSGTGAAGPVRGSQRRLHGSLHMPQLNAAESSPSTCAVASSVKLRESEGHSGTHSRPRVLAVSSGPSVSHHTCPDSWASMTPSRRTAHLGTMSQPGLPREPEDGRKTDRVPSCSQRWRGRRFLHEEAIPRGAETASSSARTSLAVLVLFFGRGFRALTRPSPLSLRCCDRGSQE